MDIPDSECNQAAEKAMEKYDKLYERLAGGVRSLNTWGEEDWPEPIGVEQMQASLEIIPHFSLTTEDYGD